MDANNFDSCTCPIIVCIIPLQSQGWPLSHPVYYLSTSRPWRH